MDIPTSLIESTIGRGDILLSEFEGISIVGKMKEEHMAEVLGIVRASKVISERHKTLYFY